MTNNQIAEQLEAAAYRQMALNGARDGLTTVQQMTIQIQIVTDFAREAAEDPRNPITY